MKILNKLFVFLLLIGFGCVANGFADDIPTLDLSQGRDYSALEKSRLVISPRNAKSSQSILNKKFKISVTKDKTISIGSQPSGAVNSWAVVWFPPGETNLQFLAFGSGYLTIEETKALMTEIRTTFEWGKDDLEEKVASSHKWLKINRTDSPYFAIEVGSSELKETPYFIRMTVAWDVSVINKQFPQENWIQQLLKSQSNSPSSSTH